MMEWLDSLWAWIMSILASFIALFTVEKHPLMDPLGSVASEASEASKASEVSDKAAEVFEALAAHVPPMLVELAAESPPNM